MILTRALKTRKGKEPPADLSQDLFIYRQKISWNFLMLCCWLRGQPETQMFLMFLSLLTLFFLQVMDIRLAVGRIRIEKLSLACRKTRSYSFTVWQHTKDGTIKDLVLSSTPCSLSFSIQPLFITLKSLCKTEDKAVLAHFSMYEKNNFLWNLAFYQTFLSNNSDSCSEYCLKFVKAHKVYKMG